MQVEPSASQVLDELRDLLRPFAPAGVEVTAGSEFVDDLALDSVSVMELVAAVEDRYDITVPLNVLPDIRTVGDLAAAIDSIRRDGADGAA